MIILTPDEKKKYAIGSRHVVKYPDCNATNNLFGGTLMMWLDEAAAIIASFYMKEERIVTRHFGGLDFNLPIERGRVVTIFCKTIKEGRTSLTLECIVTKRNLESHDHIICAKNEITFVSIDEKGKPKPWKK